MSSISYFALAACGDGNSSATQYSAPASPEVNAASGAAVAVGGSMPARSSGHESNVPDFFDVMPGATIRSSSSKKRYGQDAYQVVYRVSSGLAEVVDFHKTSLGRRGFRYETKPFMQGGSDIVFKNSSDGHYYRMMIYTMGSEVQVEFTGPLI
ncbi:hypothetical protein OKA06_15445 [Novosphingobium sp. MW5]|nr:hypothetical protein [Novosphingobium sp. MW5]